MKIYARSMTRLHDAHTANLSKHLQSFAFIVRRYLQSKNMFIALQFLNLTENKQENVNLQKLKNK